MMKVRGRPINRLMWLGRGGEKTGAEQFILHKVIEAGEI